MASIVLVDHQLQYQLTWSPVDRVRMVSTAHQEHQIQLTVQVELLLIQQEQEWSQIVWIVHRECTV